MKKLTEEQKKDLLKTILQEWEENEEHMSEYAALAVACEENGVDSQWFWDNCHLIKDN